MDHIQIDNARVHNLQGVSLTIPRNQMVVFTGVSGSGKSSLAFDTIFSEGQRRYVESLSTYARQFIGQFEKPDVEYMEGLSPAIAIDQKSVSRNPRSTVGTITEIHDYLRLLFAKIGTPHDPATGEEIQPHSLQSIVEALKERPEGARLQILSPVVRGRKGDYNALFGQLRKEGFVRIRIDGELHLLEELPEDYRLARTKLHHIEVVVDRVILKPDEAMQSRLMEAVATALRKSDGYAIVQDLDAGEELTFSRHLGVLTGDTDSDTAVEEMSPRLFSFNSPYGACPACQGIGATFTLAGDMLIPDPDKTLLKGAIAPFQKLTGRYYPSFLKRLAKRYDLRIEIPYKDLSNREQQLLLYGPEPEKSRMMDADPVSDGDGEDDDVDWFNMVNQFDGVIAILRRRHQYGSKATQDYLDTFMREETCTACMGARLKPFSLAVTLGRQHKKPGPNIDALSRLPVSEALQLLRTLTFSDHQRTIGRQPLLEVEQRLQFLMDVGLEYLSLSRSAASLSGGEAQRIRLASQIGSGLAGILYILDEPSIGLHQHNNRQLIQTLLKLRDKGNSLIVVEHDEETIRSADWVVDIGPMAGVHGGQIVAEGKPETIAQHPDSLTGEYLSGRRRILPAQAPRQGSGKTLKLENVTAHNLKNVSVGFPLGTLTAVTGMSGSGKSTLVFDVLYEALHFHLGRNLARPAGYKALKGIEHIDKAICITQTPIGRSPRSNPATYTGVFDLIRDLFARSEGAKIKGFGPGRFSFNVKGGRCETCRGDGYLVKELQFLPNVHIPCETCHGRRYNPETLAVRYKGASIADVLNMTVEEALSFFEDSSRIRHFLQTLQDVGLGYLQLGQSATTLSGGESQRIKLATEFCKRSTGKTLYLMDEPSVGLHWQDLENLILILNRLVDQGNTVVMIEHNLDLIRVADYVIDLGPEGGERGGEIVATGTPQAIAGNADSLTGRYLEL
ncbi:MAG: excinuclease ABC subunit UvrA [Candidatus Melainabacteria bacterium]